MVEAVFTDDTSTIKFNVSSTNLGKALVGFKFSFICTNHTSLQLLVFNLKSAKI